MIYVFERNPRSDRPRASQMPDRVPANRLGADMPVAWRLVPLNVRRLARCCLTDPGVALAVISDRLDVRMFRT